MRTSQAYKKALVGIQKAKDFINIQPMKIDYIQYHLRVFDCIHNVLVNPLLSVDQLQEIMDTWNDKMHYQQPISGNHDIWRMFKHMNMNTTSLSSPLVPTSTTSTTTLRTSLEYKKILSGIQEYKERITSSDAIKDDVKSYLRVYDLYHDILTSPQLTVDQLQQVMDTWLDKIYYQHPIHGIGSIWMSIFMNGSRKQVGCDKTETSATNFNNSCTCRTKAWRRRSCE